MKLKIICTSILIFIFTTSANIKIFEVKEPNNSLNFEKELLEIKLELQEADRRNQQLEFITSDNKQLRQIKRNVKNNK